MNIQHGIFSKKIEHPTLMTSLTNYRSCRSNLKKIVCEVAAAHGAMLYGSFAHDSYHLSQDTKYSFSDVDLVAAENKLAPEVIRNDILQATAIDLRISIRQERIHDSRLSVAQSIDIALLEMLYKIHQKDSEQHRAYQLSKYVLRSFSNQTYFDNNILSKAFILTMPESLTKTLVNIKIGKKQSFREEEKHRLLFEIQNKSKRYSRIATRIINNEPSEQILANVYKDSFESINGNVRLVNDIETKLKNVSLL